ncbi:ATP-binding cassette domain-containing protein [Tessaracoccus sp. ZS01]|uniref:ATP-binding cassette domain-containing protein n=1 Tax=Tessaracoccus sp. ZS01 TaxID=1906324 RepID=UPI00096F6617|nr:ATP-binding cassette domain-containing protein [Tessaracoccus sp. ZS01]MCG6567523.1 ABC transporter ATP-binding protein [Tessaracoccus sp. ZS01]OMG55889.1 hypothetical protein BJN44_07810 [Tessaracoccus sp. ZS01]
MAHSPAVVADGLSFHLPSGAVILDRVSATFPAALTGLIGPNGSGKTTLLRLIAGHLQPTAGHLLVSGRVHLLPQRVSTAGSVAELLGIAPVRAALWAIEAGSVDQAQFDAVGEDWDVEPRALAELAALGLAVDADFLDRDAGSLSGGEATRIALAGARLARADITLLDEPTNNLDTRTRRWLHDALSAWDGAVIVVSHDRDLLERVGALVDLDPRGTVSFGGPFSAYQEQRAAAQATAERRLREADAELSRAKRAAQAELQRQAQRDRSGRRERAKGNVDKMAAHYFQDRADKGSGAKATAHAGAIADALDNRSRADAAARAPEVIRIDLPDTTVPPGKRVLALRQSGESPLEVVGPERIRLTGDNGAGKSTLLARLLGVDTASHLLGDVEVALPPQVPVGVLTQTLEELDAFTSALEALRAAAPGRTPHDARALLARFLIRGDRADQPLATMSGGERFRLGLARTLFADPAPQLLVLDEPTNNLDLASVVQLVAALGDYRGALLIVTHDAHLARDLHVTRRWDLTREAGDVRISDG